MASCSARKRPVGSATAIEYGFAAHFERNGERGNALERRILFECVAVAAGLL